MLDLSWPQGKVKGESGHRWSETANRDRLFPIWQEDRGYMKLKYVDLQNILNVPRLQFEWPCSSNTSRDSILLRCNFLHRCNLTNVSSVKTDGSILGCPVNMRTPQITSKMWFYLQVLGVNFMVWNSILEYFFWMENRHAGWLVVAAMCWLSCAVISSLWFTSCLEGGDRWIPRVLLCVLKGIIDRRPCWFRPLFVDLPMKKPDCMDHKKDPGSF